MAAERSFTIDVLKALGALLIINSHLEPFHLRPWMAADGLFGNSIFFFTTGFTLAGSLQRHPDQKLGEFMWKRLSRLYPGLWIVMVLCPPITAEWNRATVVHHLVFPTFFTFVEAIVPAYPLYFLALRSTTNLRALTIISAALISAGCFLGWQHVLGSFSPGIVWGDLGRLSWFLHFGGTMLLGTCFALKWKTQGKPTPGRRTWLFFIASGMVYIVLRLMALPAMNARLGQSLQSLAVLAMPMAVTTIVALMQVLEAPGIFRWTRSPHLAGAIAFLAAHSWETYLVHEGIAQWSFVASARYPLGLILIFALTFLLAPVLRWVCNLPFAHKSKSAAA